MTSPMGWSLGDARIPEDGYDVFRRPAEQAPGAGRHRRPELAEQAAAMRGVKLCLWCQDFHFQPYPEQPGSPCGQVRCECWCTQGTGQ